MLPESACAPSRPRYLPSMFWVMVEETRTSPSSCAVAASPVAVTSPSTVALASLPLTLTATPTEMLLAFLVAMVTAAPVPSVR